MSFKRALMVVLLGAFQCYAAELRLIMEKIEIIKQSDVIGDQLYFHVLFAKNDDKLKAKLLPPMPFSYTQNNLKKFKPSTFWSGQLNDGETAEITIAFLEREMPPLLEDELLASLKVNLKVHKDSVNAVWNGGKYATLMSGNNTDLKQVFHVKHEHAEYKLTMHLEKA